MDTVDFAVPIACTLEADGGNMEQRLGEWRAVLAEATGREEIEDGVAVTGDLYLDPAAGNRGSRPAVPVDVASSARAGR